MVNYGGDRLNSDRLRSEIAAKYRTQGEFAHALRWHKNKLSKMMTGKYKPDTDEAARIADVLGLDEQRYCDIFLPQKSPNGENGTEHQKSRPQ